MTAAAAVSPGRVRLSRGAVFVLSATLVHAGNYAYNLVMARALGPAQFAEISIIVTLMLILGFGASGLQMAAAKFADPSEAQPVRDWLGRRAALLGMMTGALVMAASPALSNFFNSPSAGPYIIFGCGVPIYLSQAVRRGIAQGQARFLSLAGSYQAEMWVRLAGGAALVAAGFSVNGAVAAIAGSFAAGWIVLAPRSRDGGRRAITPALRRKLITFLAPTLALLTGEILIGHGDLLAVKHFFPPDVAGRYATLSVLGRVPFFASWSLVTVAFPLVARRQERNEQSARLVVATLGAVAAVCLTIVAGSAIFSDTAFRLAFGDGFTAMAPLLWRYAIATSLFAVAHAAATLELAAGRSAAAWLTAGAGALQTGLLWLFHGDPAQVVTVQIVAMAFYAAIVAAHILRSRSG